MESIGYKLTEGYFKPLPAVYIIVYISQMDFKRLKASGLKATRIAQAMGMSRQLFCWKVHNERFTFSEKLALSEALKLHVQEICKIEESIQYEDRTIADSES